MLIHEFGNRNLPVMLLIHGVLCPWQIWEEQISHFQSQYHVLAVALNAHTENEKSEFVSLEREISEIEQYCKDNSIDEIDVLCGISLGGKIAHGIWNNGNISVKSLVLDGAPLVPCPGFAVKIMENNYLKIIHGSKSREKKTLESFKKNFLPEKYLESYLKIADFMTDDSMRNIVRAAFNGSELSGFDNKSRALFMHGSSGSEILSKMSAARMKKIYPDTKIICFKGDSHCQKVIFEPEKWIEAVENFLKN
ncbi:alpha/beta hydrolase [Clostridiaceae bacterium OttesenSCG-928-D20]|nr:alpha/beta hydrolase [Clostridiaceae bacterium OttesenSCG-928-D20]